MAGCPQERPAPLMKCGRWATRGWGPGLLTRAEPVTAAAMSSDSALRHSGWRQTDTAAAVAGKTD